MVTPRASWWWLRFSASAGDESGGGNAGIGERSSGWEAGISEGGSGGVGDHRAGDVRCSDRVIDRVRVVAGGVGTDRQRRWNRCCDRRRWHRRRQQTGGTRADQTGEQNLFAKETERADPI